MTNGIDPFDVNTLLDRAIFGQLGDALAVRWPDWYRELIYALLDRPRPHGDWLPGGFLYASAGLIRRDTELYRDGFLKLFRGEAHSEKYEIADWPKSFVVVGHYGGGSVVIDTETETQTLFEVDKDTCIIGIFVDVGNAATSPKGFADLLISEGKD